MLKLIRESHKISGYEINIEKSVVFLYTDNELSENDINKEIQITHDLTIPRDPLYISFQYFLTMMHIP